MHDVNLRLLLNGVTNYSGGVYNQIRHCEVLTSYLCDNYGEINNIQKHEAIESVRELTDFLLSIAMVGKIEKIQRRGRRFTGRT